MLCSIFLISLVSTQSFAQKLEPNIAQNTSATRSVNSDKLQMMCHAMKLVNVDISCFYGESKERISCNENMVSGTIVVFKCKPFYKYFVDGESNESSEIICQENGEWNRTFLECVPDCGHIEPVTVNGTMSNTTVAQSPWNVAVYQISRNYTLICGGTIITPLTVVTAAHCFFDSRNGTQFNATDFEVMVGKYTRDYEKDDGTQQKHKISRLVVHYGFDPNYTDDTGIFRKGFDIAMLVLEKPIELTKYALPACIDLFIGPNWPNRGHIFGNLSGWGIINGTNPEGTVSPVLLTATLPVLNFHNCNQKLPFSDQVCVGSDSGPKVSREDGGAGLTFYKDEKKRYFLAGILSRGRNGSWDKPSSIAPYTNTDFHTNWLFEGLTSEENKQMTNILFE